MELAALDAALKKDKPAPVWLVQGEELWMVEQAVRRIVVAAVGTYDDPMLVTRVDLAEGKRGAKDVLAACRSIGLFTSKVAVLVRGLEVIEKKKDEQAELLKYAEKPAPGATLVMKASESLDGRSAFMKGMAKAAKVLTYAPLKPWQAERWVADRARQIGQRIDGDAAKLVVDLVGSSLMQLEQTLQQLSLFVGPERAIARADVENALAATRAHTIFELIDAIAEKRATLALKHVDAMLEQREYPPVILGSIVRHFRQLVDAKAIYEKGGGAPEIQSALKVHEFVAKKLADQVGRFDHATLRIAFEELYRTELELKSTRVDPALRLEALLLRLCAPSPTATKGRAGRGARA